MAVIDCPTLIHDVRTVKESLRALVASVDADAVFVFDAPELFTEFDEVERLAGSAKVLIARRVDDSCTWRSAGFRSVAEQLATVSGTSVSAANALLETSRRVADLPDTEATVRTGALSTAKAELVAAAATVAPEAEGALLESATHSPLAKVREECLKAKASVGIDATHARIKRERFARNYTDAEGAWHFHARGTVDDAAPFLAAYEPIVDELFTAARREGREEPTSAYAFDALIELARRVSNGNGDAKAARKPLTLVRVDHEALRRGAVEGDEICEIAGLGPIPVGVARDLVGDAVLKLVITKGVDVANVTHLGRSPTIAQQVALWWQSPACNALDCTRTRHLENDHREEWTKTHHTRLDESDPLCGHHHDLKTYFGWKLVAGRGKRPMVPPDDPRHPDYRRGRPPPAA